ncbi:MAG: hypothetical protein QM520_05710, partial [Gammaproteobacteria bacterium]|nr:hypothetical protein [Gammaproteobacteria bacterium]
MKKTQSEYVAGAERPLIVRLRNFVGEVVLSVPVLSQLKEIGYALHLVARHSWAVSLFSGFDATVHVQPSSLMARVRQLRELRTYCRSIDPEFDRRENALLQTDSFSSALEMWLAGLNGLGYAYDARSLMLARKLAMDRRGHVFEWYWRLGCGFWQQDLAIPKVIDLPVSDKKKVDAQSQLRELGMDAGHRFLMVCPFAATLAP